jgi:signal transduction histidine kinase
LHDLEINYIGINLSAPERIYCRYRLLGEDKTWQEAGKRRQAFYTRLRPGSYQFQLSASSGEDWSDLAVPLRIEVDPDFYQTWWFAALCVLLGVGIACLILRARMRFITEQVHSRLSERLAERERVARELHDTLLQGFQGLMMRFHLATQSIPPNEIARSEMEEA